MHRLLRLNLNDPHTRNGWYLVLEIFWAAFLSTAANFNGAYIIRLGGDNTLVGLLSSLPALMAVLVSIPAGQYLQRRSRRYPFLLANLSIHRFGFLIAAIIPWLRMAGLDPAVVTVIVLVITNIPAHIWNVGFIPLLAEVVPEHMRASVMTARNIIFNITVGVSGLIFGQWLNWAPFPLNYSVMYAFGYAMTFLSLFYLMKVDVPDSVPVPPAPSAAFRPLAQLKKMGQELMAYPDFFRITVNTFLHSIGLWAVGPLYTLYYVRTLGASDAWLGIQAALASAFTIMGWSLWRWRITRQGEVSVLKHTIILLGLYPLAVGLLSDLNWILVIIALNGLLTPAVNLTHFNTLLKVTPPESRPHYTALYMTLANLGAFICPLVGVAVAGWIGLAPTLVICGVLSILGSTSFWWWPVKSQEAARA